VSANIVELCYKEGIEMLILSRKRGEELVIGNGISVTVLEMRGDRVKLGFVAPDDALIHRRESSWARVDSLPVMGHTKGNKPSSR
jgi:carbon storage regulator CsrA